VSIEHSPQRATKKIVTGKTAADWRRGAKGVAAEEGPRKCNTAAAAFGQFSARRHQDDEIELKTNASTLEQAERAEPPLKPIVQSAQDLNRGRSLPRKTDSDFERLLTPKETAKFLRVSESWLAKARMRGDGPPYMLFGRSIRYGGGGLVRWMKSCVRQSTSER
jgi:Helix-turn-helix domain